MNVRILKAQKINRIPYQVGDVAVFDERAAKWLIDQNIAEPVDAVVAPTPRARSAVPMPRPQFVQAPRWSCCGWK